MNSSNPSPFKLTVAPPTVIEPADRPDTTLWGKDHWSLLAYLECRAVDHRGHVDMRRMRVNSVKRGVANGASERWKPESGTRLKDGSIPNPDHDDIDVFQELEDAGLVQNLATDLNPCVQITPVGFEVVHLIRQAGAAGGRYKDFNWTYPVEPDPAPVREPYDEVFVLRALGNVLREELLETIELWDQYTPLSALEHLIEETRVNRVSEDITPEEENVVDSLDFSWLMENEVLNTLSFNLTNRIEGRGYFIEDHDGKGFLKVALSLVKKRLKSLAQPTK